jgi:pSer/pThr/pTyr-binding forkhead associated (FHA) protein
MRQRQKRKARSDSEAKRFKEMEEKNLRMQEEIKRRQMTNPGEVVKNDPKKTIIAGSATAPTLKVYMGTGAQTYTLKPSQISIGRKDTNTIVIQEQTISSNHAQINFEGGQYVLTDLNSTNGTFVNGKRITKQALRNGDLVRMGAIEMKFSQ